MWREVYDLFNQLKNHEIEPVVVITRTTEQCLMFTVCGISNYFNLCLKTLAKSEPVGL
jgi:hypothetical protein